MKPHVPRPGSRTSPLIAHRNLPQLLLKAREALLAHFRPIITHFGLTEPQWRIIRALSELGALEPRQICEVCQILSPSLTGVLVRMEQMGLVERHRMEGDQRRMLVSLTARSRKIVTDMAPLIEERYRLIEEAVGKTLLDETYAQIDRLLAAPLNALPPADLSDREIIDAIDEDPHDGVRG
ncbi:homoprotocatechuate degradation operon regulator HpaR [Xanthobacter oligotrophicus]|uniref:homoprotocatechuate degradation operon regulator HpaR n=1 Tax=Xanthobacter oligotrophicus TaxID=2607286 RepID=UPI0011F3532A|nr:homoprotocatechuate degradation operon regulator HpaR [Xanthobacter oligotrophicus]MCG5237894.1 homoprotocatechuate degradation operon regulator HpaR [Xanthobacter oligotrophicus]